ncbi:hypothetical protein N9A45_00105 [bacterium]|nr:hypothetical protein [bacterium]
MFSQFHSVPPTPVVTPQIVQVKCATSGTIYYQNNVTGETAWTKKELENPRKRNK